MPPIRQSPLIPYLIMIFGFVMGFLYNNQMDPASTVPPILPKFQLTSLAGLSTLKIDYSVLTSPQFQGLKVFGQLPVKPGSGGTSNPFQ